MRENWTFVKKVGAHSYYFMKGIGKWYAIALNDLAGEYVEASFTTKKKVLSAIDKWATWMD